jgi:hypothetical protein
MGQRQRWLGHRYPGIRILVLRDVRADLSNSFQKTFEEDVVPPDHPMLKKAKVRGSRRAYNFAGSGDHAAATSGNGAYITYIDKLAAATTETFSGIYVADRNLMVRVRDGGSTPIKTFTTSAVLGSGGGSTTAIRTTDA